MATVPAKKPRKRYLHHSSELAVPKTTFYRRGQNAQSLQEAKSLAGPSHSACGNAESSTYTGDIPSSCTSNSGLQETSPVMAAESALLDESEESDTTAFDDGGSPPRYCEDEVLATAFASLSSQELPNLGTSKAGAAAMAMSFAISDGLTWTALGDLAALVNAIAGGMRYTGQPAEARTHSQVIRDMHIAFVSESTVHGFKGPSALMNLKDTLAYTHPDGIEDWVDDTREWPEIGQLNIAYYLVEANACDLRQVCNYKALESYNYVQSGWVGQLLAHKVNDEVVLVKPSGEVLRAGYTCVAGQGRVCSHVGAVLWKIESAVSRGLTGKACTDFAAAWNKGTKRNVEPSNIEDINFKLPRTSVDPDPLAQRQPRDMLVPLGKQEIQELHRDSGYAGLFNVPDQEVINLCCMPPTNDIDILPGSWAPCNTFYKEFVELSPAAAAALEENTRSQSSAVWHAARRIRLTASNIKKRQ
ncbi:hypothetical protein HPB50_027927 [Hyalomma asiaticum]|nr:hypothetical protein HPB50_027927 [Hyalomma asiaticum]